MTVALRPPSIDEAQRLLQDARGSIAFAGGGTEMTALPAVDAVMYTAGLNRIIDYAPSDQVVTVEAGVTLQALQMECARHGQRLALDVPQADRATLGGIVAANTFGPLRTRYGSVRDLIIGVSILRADGTRAKGGGKVVKTVAGFDLPKLMCGSRGTLGMIATVTFRVHPLPEHSVDLAARGLTAAGVVDLMVKLRALQLEPAALMATRSGSLGQPATRSASGWDVALRFEGFRAGVEQQREKLRDLDVAPGALWADHLASRGKVRFGALPTQLPQLEAAFGEAVSWYPTLGLGFAASAGKARPVLAALGGWLVDGNDFGPPPPALPLHQAMKARLDPEGRLAPGTFIGGI